MHRRLRNSQRYLNTQKLTDIYLIPAKAPYGDAGLLEQWLLVLYMLHKILAVRIILTFLWTSSSE